MFSMALLCLSQLVLLVGSVSYGPTFPSPLSKEEEKETIARMMEGDQEAKHSLITHNLRLVAHICKKICRQWQRFGRFDFHWQHRADQGGEYL